MKGPVLAEFGYGDPGARLYEDLDLVVPASDLSCGPSTRWSGPAVQVTDSTGR